MESGQIARQRTRPGHGYVQYSLNSRPRSHRLGGDFETIWSQTAFLLFAVENVYHLEAWTYQFVIENADSK